MTTKKCEGLTFAECELAILRMAVDSAEKKIGKQVVNSPEVKRMIVLLENFMKKKRRHLLRWNRHQRFTSQGRPILQYRY